VSRGKRVTTKSNPPPPPTTEPDAAVVQRNAAAHVDAFLSRLRDGTPWVEALLDAVSAWDLPEETVAGRHFAYLIGGEAFDWLLLAERLCEEALPAGLAPETEVEALLWEERFPQPMTEETFKQMLGPSKYRAHLNFLYGVRVEEALQLTVELQVQKERGSITLNHDPRIGSEQDPFARIYGASTLTLLREFRDQTGGAQTDRITLSEWKQFTYWLFKRRLAVQDPARVASDTRRGLLQLQRLEELKQQRITAGGRTPATAPRGREQATAAVIEGVAVPVR